MFATRRRPRIPATSSRATTWACCTNGSAMVDEAIEAFTRVADGQPDDAAAHYHLGVNYKHKGLDDLAIGEFAPSSCSSIRATAPRRRAALARTLSARGLRDLDRVGTGS